MASDLDALRFDAHDPDRLAAFWAGVLGWTVDRSGDHVVVEPADGAGYRLRFAPTQAPKVGQNRIHLDLTSTSAADQQDVVDRALGLGGRHLDIGQTPDDGHVVLADPEGNEFCVIEPRNDFLAGCGLVGAINCDGTRELGYFWSHALGWPLVWDQDQETAIQAPSGGSKIAWGGPPLMPQEGKNRLQLDLAPVDGDLHGEVDRLLSLGASRPDRGGISGGDVVLLDPDGNEFCVRATGRGPAPV